MASLLLRRKLHGFYHPRENRRDFFWVSRRFLRYFAKFLFKDRYMSLFSNLNCGVRQRLRRGYIVFFDVASGIFAFAFDTYWEHKVQIIELVVSLSLILFLSS